jgi:hypothetical protein
MVQRKVELAGDLLAIAEDELSIPGEQLLQKIRLEGIEESLDLGPVEAPAVVAAWVIRRKPFASRNVEIGYRCMRLMLKEASLPWPRPDDDAVQVSGMLKALDAGFISEARFAEWVCLRVATA